MGTDRRDFIRTSALAAGAVGLGLTQRLAAETSQPSPASTGKSQTPLKVLFLGGTGFIGPHTIELALARGHEVTMFNRGQTNPDIFPDVERLIGDRNDNLTALEGRSWDVVLDLPATDPKWVELSAQLLKDRAELYLHISSESVYSDTSVRGIDETGPVFRREDVEIPENGLPYGLSKVLAENEARRAFGEDRALIVRPGLIVGPLDPTDRFTYWPVRIERGGEIFAPGDGTDHVQIIDVRDLATFILDLVEQRTAGTFNATGPASPMTMAEMLHGIRAATSNPLSFTWASVEFMEEQEVRPWRDMPAWVPERGGMVGFGTFSNTKALDHGLKLRPLAETAADTIEWHHTRPEEKKNNMRAGITAEREAELLKLWHERG